MSPKSKNFARIFFFFYKFEIGIRKILEETYEFLKSVFILFFFT